MVRAAAASKKLLKAISTRSYSTPFTYAPPLASNTLPAYDHALAYLAQDKEQKLAQLARLHKSSSATQEELDVLEVAAWVNDPETRASFKAGNADWTKPVFRHLAEREWRKEGELAVLMQRVTQMNITPDLLPEIIPTVNLKISMSGEGSSPIEPGSYTLPQDSRTGINVDVQVYHAEEKLYTLLLVDPDVPDESTQSFSTYAHWLIPNISLSSTSTSSLSSTPAFLPFIPPHPQKGTPYHRYTLLLFLQSSSLDLSSSPISRELFDVRQFVKENQLETAGVNFFRQVWSPTVSDIYRDDLGLPEPKFGIPKRKPSYKSSSKYELM